MASCNVCRRTIVLGGLTVGAMRYCSSACAKKGALKNAVEPGNLLVLPPINSIWVIMWIIIAVCATSINFAILLAASPKEFGMQIRIAAPLGFILVQYFIAGICTVWKKHRNLYSFFKVAGIMSMFMFFASLGQISTMRNQDAKTGLWFDTHSVAVHSTLTIIHPVISHSSGGHVG